MSILKKYLTINATGNWTATTSDSWITLDTMTGTPETTTLGVSVTINTKNAQRNGIVTVRTKDDERVITISQYGAVINGGGSTTGTTTGSTTGSTTGMGETYIYNNATNTIQANKLILVFDGPTLDVEQFIEVYSNSEVEITGQPEWLNTRLVSIINNIYTFGLTVSNAPETYSSFLLRIQKPEATSDMIPLIVEVNISDETCTLNNFSFYKRIQTISNKKDSVYFNYLGPSANFGDGGGSLISSYIDIAYDIFDNNNFFNSGQYISIDNDSYYNSLKVQINYDSNVIGSKYWCFYLEDKTHKQKYFIVQQKTFNHLSRVNPTQDIIWFPSNDSIMTPEQVLEMPDITLSETDTYIKGITTNENILNMPEFLYPTTGVGIYPYERQVEFEHNMEIEGKIWIFSKNSILNENKIELYPSTCFRPGYVITPLLKELGITGNSADIQVSFSSRNMLVVSSVDGGCAFEKDSFLAGDNTIKVGSITDTTRLMIIQHLKVQPHLLSVPILDSSIITSINFINSSSNYQFKNVHIYPNVLLTDRDVNRIILEQIPVVKYTNVSNNYYLVGQYFYDGHKTVVFNKETTPVGEAHPYTGNIDGLFNQQLLWFKIPEGYTLDEEVSVGKTYKGRAYCYASANAFNTQFTFIKDKF